MLHEALDTCPSLSRYYRARLVSRLHFHKQKQKGGGAAGGRRRPKCKVQVQVAAATQGRGFVYRCYIDYKTDVVC
jgi:hypothetical protein